MFGKKKTEAKANDKHKSKGKPKFKRLKKLDELEEGRCIIVTDHGKISSSVGPGIPTLLSVPNNYTIYGFIQNKRTAQKPPKKVSERVKKKRLKQAEKELKKYNKQSERTSYAKIAKSKRSKK